MGLTSFLLLTVFLVVSLADDIRQPPHIYKFETKANFEFTPASEKLFTCKARGVPEPVVKWVLTKPYAIPKSSATPLSADGNMRKYDFKPTMAGEYQCQAENEYGVDVTNHVRLRLAHDATFDPSKVYTVAGTVGLPINLKCQMTRDSLPNAIYTWRVQKQSSAEGATSVNEESISLGWRRSVGLDGTLYFAYLQPEDNQVKAGDQWYYMCETKNVVVGGIKWGGDTKLNINSGSITNRAPSLPSDLVSMSKVVHVLQGETLQLFCFFNGYPEIKYSWSKSGGLPPSLRSDEGTRLSVKDTVDTPLFNGEYVCKGKNAASGTPTVLTYTVVIDVLPYFVPDIGEVKDTNTTIGGDVSFKCIAMGKPMPKVSWLVNNKPVNKATKGPKVTFTTKGNEGTYTILNLQKGSSTITSDIRVVSCLAVSSVGETYSSGYINIFTPLNISVKPKSVDITIRDQVILIDCIVTVDPSQDYTVKWFLNKTEIKFQADKIFMHANNTLEVKVAKYKNIREVLGNYMCQVQTKAPLQTKQESASVYSKGNIAAVTTAGSANLWWIAIIVAIILIIIILLLIFCCIKRNRGESYPVDENERKTGNDPEKDLHKPEHGGFADYQRSEKDPIGGSRASLDGSIKPLDSDDDADSMAEYGDNESGTGKFNEDGSFIGQYTDKHKHSKEAGPPPYSKDTHASHV